jgi:hypothetical protein
VDLPQAKGMTMLGIVSTILGTLTPFLTKRAKAEAEIQEAPLAQQTAVIAAAKHFVVADAQSEGWLTRKPRPCVVFWVIGGMSWIVAIAPVFGPVDKSVELDARRYRRLHHRPRHRERRQEPRRQGEHDARSVRVLACCPADARLCGRRAGMDPPDPCRHQPQDQRAGLRSNTSPPRS